MEGGHSRTYADRLSRADTFIWLDFPVGLRLFRVLKRSAMHFGQTRPDLPEGCPERFNWQTVAFLHFILKTRLSSRAKLEAIYREPPPHLEVHKFTSSRDVGNFLKAVESAKFE